MRSLTLSLSLSVKGVALREIHSFSSNRKTCSPLPSHPNPLLRYFINKNRNHLRRQAATGEGMADDDDDAKKKNQQQQQDSLIGKKKEEEEKAKEVVDDVPSPPEKPLPGDCCGSGCVRCVWDIYYEELEDYNILYGKAAPQSKSKSN